MTLARPKEGQSNAIESEMTQFDDTNVYQNFHTAEPLSMKKQMHTEKH